MDLMQTIVFHAVEMIFFISENVLDNAQLELS